MTLILYITVGAQTMPRKSRQAAARSSVLWTIKVSNHTSYYHYYFRPLSRQWRTGGKSQDSSVNQMNGLWRETTQLFK